MLAQVCVSGCGVNVCNVSGWGRCENLLRSRLGRNSCSVRRQERYQCHVVAGVVAHASDDGHRRGGQICLAGVQRGELFLHAIDWTRDVNGAVISMPRAKGAAGSIWCGVGAYSL